jgi:hypothetical protein
MPTRRSNRFGFEGSTFAVPFSAIGWKVFSNIRVKPLLLLD